MHLQTVDLGLTSLTALGVLGVIIEVVLIGYLVLASLVGLYTIPIVHRIRPVMGATSLTHLILNCALFLVLSSALPLLSKILGKLSALTLQVPQTDFVTCPLSLCRHHQL